MTTPEPMCAAEPRVRLGILGTALMGNPDLREGLERLGVAVVVEETLGSFISDIERQREVEVLLVDLEQADDDDLDVLDALLEHSPVPLVFHEDSSRSTDQAWLRRLAEKIEQAAQNAAAAPMRPIALTQPPAPVQEVLREPKSRLVPGTLRVWVLGASFGGPEALKRFLTSFSEPPPNTAFIIGQHIGDGFVEVLASQLNRATPFRVLPAATGARLQPGTIYVAPVRERLRIDGEGGLYLEPHAPPTTYMPSIDAIMEEVAGRFGERCGAIVFSGMGDDGSQGCTAIARAGGTVWAQESESCAIDSMPNCARATGLVRRNGTPENLARALFLELAQTVGAMQ